MKSNLGSGEPVVTRTVRMRNETRQELLPEISTQDTAMHFSNFDGELRGLAVT